MLMLNHEGFRLHGIETATCSDCGSAEFSYEEMMMKLEVLPLNQHTFSTYGDVIETHKRDFFHINDGLVERYHDTANVEVWNRIVRSSVLTARNRRLCRLLCMNWSATR